MTMAKILLVDDDRDLTHSLSQILRIKGYEVVVAYSGTEGLKNCSKPSPIWS